MDGIARLRAYLNAPKSAPSASSSSEDADFADFAGAPDPSPASIISAATDSAAGTQPTVGPSSTGVVYTKWYRVWERTSPQDFKQEALILPFVILLIAAYTWGRRTNKRKAKAWARAHAPLLEKEYAVVGFGGRRAPSLDDVQSSGLVKAQASDALVIPEELLKEKTASEFVSYATGRQNVAFVDIKLSLLKRYSPFMLAAEYIASFFLESFAPPMETMEATAYAFDGKEKELIPVPKREQEALEARVKGLHSTYDGFVWAVVNKDGMKRLRDERYDLSLTSTRDNSKLPVWASVMSESAEITDLLLTPELVKAIEKAGNLFHSLIVSDQPIDRPRSLSETTPRKRISLTLLLPPSSSSSTTTPPTTNPIFTHFLRLPDTLVSNIHLRPEVTRKIRSTRDEMAKRLSKKSDEERAEERRLELDRKKKEVRDNKLKGMSAGEQRKFLERERERGIDRNQKKGSVRAKG